MRYTIIIALFLVSFLCIAQKDENLIAETYNKYKSQETAEYAYLRTDKRIYFSGESVGFYLTILNQYLKPSSISKVAYVELINEDLSIRKRYAFNVKRGISHGDIEIPTDMPSGNYQLMAYTYFMNNINMEQAAHRRLIYIQNTSDPVGAVAKSIRIDSSKFLSDSSSSDDSFSMKMNETSSRIFLEISTSEKTNKNYYIASEGFRGLQFIAKTKLNKKTNNLVIRKEQLNGNFQKLILIDEDYNVLTALAFYLDNPMPLNHQYQVNAQSVAHQSRGNLISRVELTSEVLHQDSVDLFRRMYQLFYRLPPYIQIQHLSFEELTSDQQLLKVADYSKSYWNDALSKESSDIKFYPEKSLHLRATVEGDLGKLNEAVFAAHFFNSGLDIFRPIEKDGRVNIEMSLPIPSDQIFYSILNSDVKGVSSEYKVTIDQGPNLGFGTIDAYYSRDVTDTLINNRMKLAYIFSTFKDMEDNKKFFWERYKSDRVVKVKDYRAMQSFEEFVKEAIPDLSVVNDEDAKGLNIYNTYKGGFSKPEFYILNNQILKDPTPFFELPIESIESVRMMISKESLLDFSKTIRSGVIIVETNESVAVSPKYLNDRVKQMPGFDRKVKMINPVAKQFNYSKLMMLHSLELFNFKIEDNKETGIFNFNIETIQRDGTYSHRTDQFDFN